MPGNAPGDSPRLHAALPDSIVRFPPIGLRCVGTNREAASDIGRFQSRFEETHLRESPNGRDGGALVVGRATGFGHTAPGSLLEWGCPALHFVPESAESFRDFPWNRQRPPRSPLPKLARSSWRTIRPRSPACSRPSWSTPATTS